MNGVSPEKVPASLPQAAPKTLWKASLGTGTAAVTVSGDRAYSMGNTGDKDIIYCFDVRTGKEIWRHSFPLDLDKRMFEGGPASTPTVDGNRVYTVSHQGDVWCLDAQKGTKIWYRHFQKDFGGKRPQWGFAGSPTIEGNMVLLDVGGSGASTVALNKTDGKIIWKSGDDAAGYASPVVAEIGGKRTVVVFKAEHVVGLDPKSGRELWRSGWKTEYDVNAATPLVLGDRVFISSGYNAGCAMVQVANGAATELWRNKNLRSHVNSPTAWQGQIFGVDGQTGGGNLVCLDPATGERHWEEKSVKGGALIAASGRLIQVTEKGELVVSEASTGGYKELHRSKVLSGRCWVQPTLANGRLFVKNNDGELLCLDFGAK
jgi:outer membrane protein assembly factor BamB